jgi:hypothetical protein
MLDGWRVISLVDAPQRHVSIDELRQAIAARRSGRGATPAILTASISQGGSASACYRQVPPPADLECRELARELCDRARFSWSSERLILLDGPCYIVVDGGVVLFDDGSIIAETLFPSTGQMSIERQVGGGLGQDNGADEVRQALVVEHGTWAPLLSRWSAVYFHAVTECLVQDTVLASAGLSPLLLQAVPLAPRGAQRIVVSHASSRLERCTTLVMKVPRAVFSTVFFKHSALGATFRQFVQRIRAEIAIGEPHASCRGPKKIYVSRIGAAARRMTNEPELIARLRHSGFHIFRGEGLSLLEQARAFRDATLIVGPHGSGLTNVAFAPPGATLCELRPLYTREHTRMDLDEYSRLCAVTGVCYCAHVSANDRDADKWEANIPEIIETIEAIT